MSTNAWIDQMFEADQANTGGVIRRATRNVETLGGGLDNLVEVVRDRGFHLIETGDQVVIFCHEGALRIHC